MTFKTRSLSKLGNGVTSFFSALAFVVAVTMMVAELSNMVRGGTARQPELHANEMIVLRGD